MTGRCLGYRGLANLYGRKAVTETTFWEVRVDYSSNEKIALLVRQVVYFKGNLKACFILSPIGETIFFLVELPLGTENDFMKSTGFTLRPREYIVGN
jgi:hypothetical protein